MAKGEKIDFDDLEDPFQNKTGKKPQYSDKELLDVIKDPLKIEDLPVGETFYFWKVVLKRLKDSREFRSRVLKAVKNLTKEGK